MESIKKLPKSLKINEMEKQLTIKQWLKNIQLDEYIELFE